MSADILPLPQDRTIDGKNVWPVVTSGAATPHEYLLVGGVAIRDPARRLEARSERYHARRYS